MDYSACGSQQKTVGFNKTKYNFYRPNCGVFLHVYCGSDDRLILTRRSIYVNNGAIKVFSERIASSMVGMFLSFAAVQSGNLLELLTYSARLQPKRLNYFLLKAFNYNIKYIYPYIHLYSGRYMALSYYPWSRSILA